MTDIIPRALRGKPPWDDLAFVKIDAVRADGLPDGVHTGGVWRLGDEVWKPLDGGNAHDGDHESTHEAECLEEMAGTPGFPRDWRVEVVDGRRWLVRPFCLVAGTDDLPWRQLPSEMWEFVERAIRALNAKGWELGDSIPTLAYDPTIHEYLILDLSCAYPTYKVNKFWNDEDRFYRWLTLAGYDRIRKFREAGRHVVTSLEYHDRYDIPYSWGWVYASRNRPLSLTWAHRLRDVTRLVPADYDRVHTWAVAGEQLPDDVVFDYELTLAWCPWDTPARRSE